MTTLEVPWPGAALSPKQWTDRLSDLASRAEALVGRPCSLQDQARLACEAFGLLWPAMGPELVAGSARATLLLQVPVVLNAAPADAVQEITERLDRIWQEAQDDPAQAVADGGVLLLERPPCQPAPGRPPAPEPVYLVPEPEQVVEAVVEEVAVEVEEVEPQPPAPDTWLSASEVCELLEISPSTLKNWRNDGKFGQGWGKCGRGYRYSPEVVEGLLDQLVPPSLVELMDQIRKEREA